ncbi:MAG: hypothetical protein ABIS69_00775 [Sediminibacterium sp.]
MGWNNSIAAPLSHHHRTTIAPLSHHHRTTIAPLSHHYRTTATSSPLCSLPAVTKQ